MDNANTNDPYVQKPTLTSDGKPWAQRCLYCLKSIDFIKDPAAGGWLRVGQYVRHRKCYPS